jgi:aspartyl-tRNA(Asn)/glutamyl-tRNA(Gln) amidotransferase subunit B
MPKNYQISQYDMPLTQGGVVHYWLEDGTKKSCRLTRIHLEEDTGKSTHAGSGDGRIANSTYSLVDFNRAGVPLMECVSDPDIRSAEEAVAYLEALKRTFVELGVSDVKMEEGSLRCDANVSVRPVGQEKFGVRVEIKNLNSFRAVEAAIDYEIANQIALIRAGRGAEIRQQTKLWDPDAKMTKPMRGKEEAADYRYFPDPDLPPLHLPPERVAAIRATMPELPRDREARLVKEHGLDPAVARELTMDREVADYFEELVKKGKVKPNLAANWTREESLRLAAKWHQPIGVAAPFQVMSGVINLVSSGMVARVVAKQEIDNVFAAVTGDQDVKAYFEKKGMIQVQDAGQLSTWVAQVIQTEAKAAADVKAGKTAAIGRLVGVTMKLSGGKAEPNAVKTEILKQLGG